MKISEALKDEDGSAIIEFIMIALPLFIPLAIFMTNVQADASIQYQSRNLVRQIARVYATSDSELEGIQRLTVLRETFMEEIFDQVTGIQVPEIFIRCSRSPCLIPGSKVQVVVVVKRSNGHVLANVAATALVDAGKSLSA